jgi:predicted ATPase
MATAETNVVRDIADEKTKPPFLRRVRIRGYKSIAFCEVELKPLTILVGRNASGKSNFLDALAFLRDVIDVGAVEAVKRRGGWSAIHCRTCQQASVGIEVEVAFSGWLPGGSPEGTPGPSVQTELIATYSVEIPAPQRGMPPAMSEKLGLRQKSDNSEVNFDLDQGRLTFNVKGGDGSKPLTIPISSGIQSQQLEPFLLRTIHVQPLLSLALGLRSMGFYNFQPDAIRVLQRPNPGGLLERDGNNLASVIEGLREIDEESVDRIKAYLSAVVDQVEDFQVVRYGEYETIRFRLRSDDRSAQVEFDAASMSDGTLRALAALVAAFQIHLPTGPSVVGIEEPETALHPAAMGALIDALAEATERTQVILTTHSADLLVDPDLDLSQVLVVRSLGGQTYITPVDAASREIVRKELSTLADLQRMDQLDLDQDDLERQNELQNGHQGG